MSRAAAAAFLAAIAAALAVGAFGSAAWQTALATGGPACPFHRLTGIDCPFCGMTRATIALGRGDLRTALHLHPLAPIVLVGLVALLAIVAAGRGALLVRGRRPHALLGAVLAVWVLRLAL